MENNLVLLIYGNVLPPKNHILKIVKSYGKQYRNDMTKINFNEDNYYDIRIEERYTGLESREDASNIVVPVKKEFLSKFVNIFNNLVGEICLCKTNHEHPMAIINGKHYEGYSYYLVHEEKQILFVEEYSNEKSNETSDGNFIELFELISEKPGFDMNNIDLDHLGTIMNSFSEHHPEKKWFSVKELDWFIQSPQSKRWVTADANADTCRIFEHWLISLINLNEELIS